MNDPMTVATWVAFGFAVLFVIGVTLWAIVHKRTPATLAPPTDTRPYSISRAMDDLKHYHADQIIGQALGVAQAGTLGSVLGPLATAKPPDAPKA
jgi:hypothetical protein